ncbi:hypothetical protein FVR03_22770 [Pontibacter qinzhouensis]|uniref:Uncharacterized protein n=1 Tax=Pontibacter qinzhouensis TaxID=2603253 RepID=A0A5C8IR07_9BACT|nr:hypothetical protein [Pontibacter qinzhouensis]TXK23325.1 hypothetical protein FVR03_22770 [Pontibacter qinzhouensis]
MRNNIKEWKSTIVGILLLVATGFAVAYEKMPAPEVLIPFMVIVGVAHIMLNPDEIRKYLLGFLKKKLED